MTRRRWVLVAAVGALAIGAIAAWQVRSDEDPQRLAGAELFASGGNEEEWASLDDAPVEAMSLLSAGEGGSFYALVEDVVGLGALVEASSTGEIERAGDVALPGGGPRRLAFAIGMDGRYAVVRYREATVWEFNLVDGFPVEARFDVGAVGWTEDGTLLVGSSGGAMIDSVDEDGSFRRLLGPADDAEAVVHTAESLGPIVSLAAMSDGRIAFVAGAGEDAALYVLDDQEVRPVEVDAAGSFAFSVESPADESIRADRFPIQPLAAAPDGQVLVMGEGDGGAPQISLVDVDSGDVEVLAELDGVEPTIEQPVSAVAAGDDLVFLADDRLWRLADAFG